MITRPATHRAHSRRPWQNVEIIHLAHGQPRPYADSRDVLLVTFTGGHPAATEGQEFPWGICPEGESGARLAKQQIRGFVNWRYDKTLGETGAFHESYLETCEWVDGDEWSNTWKFGVTQPYLD